MIDALHDVVAEVNRTPAQVALRWVMQQPVAVRPIVGCRTPEQLADNLGAGQQCRVGRTVVGRVAFARGTRSVDSCGRYTAMSPADPVLPIRPAIATV